MSDPNSSSHCFEHSNGSDLESFSRASSDSSMSSPYKGTSSKLTGTDWSPDSASPMFKGELQGKIHDEVPISQFVRYICRVPEDTVNKILKLQDFSAVSEDDMQDYRNACNQSEKAMYPIFIRISQCLFTIVVTALGGVTDDHQDLLGCLVQDGRKILKSDSLDATAISRHKGDMSFLTRPPTEEFKTCPYWTLVKCPGDIKRGGALVTHNRGRSGSTALMSCHPSGSRLSGLSTLPGRKRGRSPDTIGSSASWNKHFKSETTAAQDQLSSYAQECLANPNRFFTVGFSVNRTTLTLTYFDRMLAIRSVCFNMFNNMSMFALVIYALFTMDSQQAGFNTFLHPCSTVSTTATTESERYPVETMIGVFFEFPARELIDELENKDLSELKHNKVKAGARSNVNSFEILEAIFRPQGLTGQVTGVWKTRASIVGRAVQEELALKASWQLDIRTPESELIRLLHTRIPEFKAYLPEIAFSDIITLEEVGLPWKSWDGFDPTTLQTFEQHSWHVLASRLYTKLWKMANVEEFKKVWLDCVRCHHAAWKTGKILHRDLSENNLMCHRQDKPGGTPIVNGILNDWDMASQLADDDQVPRSAAQHQTGTLPFMAIDLLESDPPPHYYRHDLESFFYILLWASIHYTLEGDPDSAMRQTATPKLVEFWNLPDMTTVRRGKFEWFSNRNKFQREILNKETKIVQPIFMKACGQWLWNLHLLFCRAFARPESDFVYPEWGPDGEPVDQPQDSATHWTKSDIDKNGKLTYETFMQALNEKP